MGKSFELLGLAAFNIFLAIILSATFLTNAGVSVDTLNESNVEGFITRVAEISGGRDEAMDQYSITSFFMDHISDDSTFVSTIEYNMPDMEDSARELEMDKMTFISHVLQGMQAMDKHESAVQIDHIDIADNGKSARVVTTNYERGVMPVDDGFGDIRMMPVMGTSYCEQKLVLSQKRTIQMAGAECSTSISFQESY